MDKGGISDGKRANSIKQHRRSVRCCCTRVVLSRMLGSLAKRKTRVKYNLCRTLRSLQDRLEKPYREHEFSSIAVLKICAAGLTSNILPQKIWPLHAYPLGKNLDCVNWNNARRSRTSRTAINIFMAILSFALSCIFALPVTFSASLSQIQDLTKNISWLHWVSRVPPRALEYIQGAAPQLFVGIVVALVPSILIYLSSWHCHVTSAKVEIAYYRYYSAFLFLQAFLLVGLSSSLVVTLSEVLTQPSAIPRVLALNLPKAGNYFISFLTLQGFSLFADLVAQWRWLSVKAFENWMATPTPRHIACLNSRDPFSLTSMYSTVMLLGVIGKY